MYINPNTTIYILKGIPLNKSYENTVWYGNAQLQQEAFMKYKKFTLSEYSYQRTQLGTLRVELSYNQLYDCNYMVFQNTSYGQKWFYAFITGVAYINDSVSEIYYELDVMQTWCYDYEFLPCFVERRHQNIDAVYGNLQPEGLELGPDYATRKTTHVALPVRYCCQLSDLPSGYTSGTSKTIEGLQGWEADGMFIAGNESAGFSINGIVSGLYYASCTDLSTFSRFISAVRSQGLEDAIVALYEGPAQGYYNHKQGFSADRSNAYPAAVFTPKNMKLYSSPFCYITVTNNRGLSRDYRPEYWTHTTSGTIDTFEYWLQGVSYPQSDARLVPSGYNDGNSAIDNCLHWGSWPQCAISGNSYAVWWAQNQNNYIATMNAIGNSYDTNVAIAQNNYTMAERSAQASAAASQASINTGLANTYRSYGANNANLARMYQLQGTQTGFKQAGDLLKNALSLNLGGVAATTAGMFMNSEAMDVSLQNTSNSMDTALNNSVASAGTAQENSQLALSTALKNASTSQASATLSALTNKQNATAQLLAKKQDIANLPNTAKGNAMGDGFPYWEEKGGGEGTTFGPSFEIIYKSINVQWAKIIDDYFTVYGYAQGGTLMKPEQLNMRINRKHFSYLKTVGCSIKGNLNSNDQIAIQAIYNNGIETWDTLENVGNYDIDNGTIY